MKLEEAYRWYHSARKTFQRTSRLARKYWDDLPHDLKLFQDAQFVELQAVTFEDDAITASSQLDDLGVLFLFASFEHEFREHVALQTISDADSLRHPVALKAINDVVRQVESDSLDRILSGYAASVINDDNLILRVQQIRHFRNWVAHGKHGDRPSHVDPITTYQILKEFLDIVRQESKRLNVL